MQSSFRQFLIAAAISVSSASAEPLCLTLRDWRPSIAEGQPERNLILAGETGHADAWSEPRSDWRAPAARLIDVLNTLGIAAALLDDAGAHLPCDTPQQADILTRRVRELGPAHLYIGRLAANQVRALKTCETRRQSQTTEMPIRNWDDLPDTDGRIATIAVQDFDYLTGVSHFYTRQYDNALARFSTIGADSASPHRAAARIMVVRTLRELGRPAEAYEAARRFRIEATVESERTALDEQEDIIALSEGTPDQAAAHLEKVFSRVAHLPIENEQAGFRLAQAATDLEYYFVTETARLANSRYNAPPHDWWLRAEPPEGDFRAFAAVHQVAKRIDGVDWIQAYHASDAYTRPNSWFSGPDFDVDTPDYERVTAHAFRKWKGGSTKWGLIVAKRMAPKSRYVREVEAEVLAMHKKAAACALSSSEFVIYARMTQHLARAFASAGQYEKAFSQLTAMQQNRLYPTNARVDETYEALTRLLLVRGRQDLVHTFNVARTEQWSGFRLGSKRYFNGEPSAKWDEQDLDDLAAQQPKLFLSMLNVMSSDDIERYVTPQDGRMKLPPDIRLRATNVLWMRAYIFGDEARMARIGPEFFSYHPHLKRYDRQAKAAPTREARNFAYAVMVLRNPGLTPYHDTLMMRDGRALSRYDRLNPVEGNWWCAADDRAMIATNDARLRKAFFDPLFVDQLFYVHSRGRLRKTQAERDKSIVDPAWTAFRRSYPPFADISEAEQARLARLPRAAEWLAETVKAYVESPVGIADRKTPIDERIPESLHRIVDVTRYACNKSERGNAITSVWAYKTLHRYYGETTWAAETPYWYDKSFNPRR